MKNQPFYDLVIDPNKRPTKENECRYNAPMGLKEVNVLLKDRRDDDDVPKMDRAIIVHV